MSKTNKKITKKIENTRISPKNLENHRRQSNIWRLVIKNIFLCFHPIVVKYCENIRKIPKITENLRIQPNIVKSMFQHQNCSILCEISKHSPNQQTLEAHLRTTEHSRKHPTACENSRKLPKQWPAIHDL